MNNDNASDGDVFFLFDGEVDRILRILYDGTRPPRIEFLICSCGASASLRFGDAQAIGWQILPHAACPACVAKIPYLGPARKRFIDLVDKLTGKEG